jgi:DNA-binding transcriptional LysR family regulator
MSGNLLELHGPGGEREMLRLEPSVQASQVSALHAMCVAGWGISVGVSAEDHTALADGRLAAVLPAWQIADLPVYAVTQRRTEQPTKVRHTLDLLATHFTENAQDLGTRGVRH